MLLLLSVLWGGSFFFVEVAVSGLPTLTIVALRVGLAAAALWIIAGVIEARAPRDPQVWASFATMGALNNVVPFALIVWGQQNIASGLASILNATTPLFTVLVAAACLSDERFTARKGLGVCLGFIGAAVLIGPDALAGAGDSVWAQLAILGAAFSYAVAGVFGRRFKRLGISPIVTAAGQVSASTLLLAPAALALERPWTTPAPGVEVWAAIAGLALLSTAAAYILYFALLARAGATNLLLVTFLIPVSALGLGAAFLGETMTGAHVVGMTLITLGLLAIDGRLLARRAVPE